GGTAAIRDAVVGRFLSSSFRARHPDTASAIGAMLDAAEPNGYLRCCLALRDADLHEDAARVVVPTLIIGSSLDESTPPALAAELHALIPSSELVVIPEAVHLSNVERPDVLNAALLRFLQTAGPRT
ncbi:MAG: alpha/beta hydrolase, partial [Gemmatimonadaceae bacterium]